MKFVFIVNPIAGNDDKARIFARIKSTFRQIDDEMIIEETKCQGDAKRIALEYSQQYGGNCIIVSCGGDGTVHEIANGLAGSDTPMLILPLGTGNDFAKKVYGTKKINVENVIKAFGFYNGKIKYDIKPIDLIDYNGEKCINVMSFGLDTLVETIGKKLADKAPFLGHNAYNLGIVPVIMKPLHYSISYDINCIDKKTGENFNYKSDNKDYALFAICNASYYGGGFMPAPDAVLDDGKLDFVLVKGLSLAKALPLISKYSEGKVNSDAFPDVIEDGYAVSGRVWMEDGSPLLGNCDGENFDYSEVNFKVENKALKLCVIKD
ncbi:MAG: YegS/Rv2252/BmrU family lipid kinase [Eubacterium sp.]|nr:YegS/Rv2252/BmrU family lipid kinase [Eubacterium sp.]